MKICSICKVNKPDSEFHKDKRKRTGLRSGCKQCDEMRYAKQREERKKTPEARARKSAWNRGRERSETAKARERKHAEKRRIMYPEKAVAQRAVIHAIRRGDLIRPEVCQGCNTKPPKGKNGRSTIHAHHEDYSKPLEVKWLCLDCHSKEHNRALAPEESAAQTQDNPGDGNDAISQAGCKSDAADLIPGLDGDNHEVLFALEMAVEHDERHQALALRTWLPRIQLWYRQYIADRNVLRIEGLELAIEIAQKWVRSPTDYPQQIIDAIRAEIERLK